MFVEADRFVIVAVEQTLAMQTRLVDQAREVDVASETLVRTARTQFFHQLQA